MQSGGLTVYKNGSSESDAEDHKIERQQENMDFLNDCAKRAA